VIEHVKQRGGEGERAAACGRGPGRPSRDEAREIKPASLQSCCRRAGVEVLFNYAYRIPITAVNPAKHRTDDTPTSSAWPQQIEYDANET